MDDNNLTGPIPPGLGDLPNLKLLYLHQNQFEGDVPESLANLVNLFDPGTYYGMDGLDLDYNALNVPAGYPDPGSPLQVFLSQKDYQWHTLQGFEQPIDGMGGILTALDERAEVIITEGTLISDTLFTFTPQRWPHSRHWLS